MTSRSALVLATLLALLALPSAAPAEVINRVVLRVNDQIATLEEFVERRNARLAAIAEAEGLSEEDRRRLTAEADPATMREIFEELLIVSRAQQLKLEVRPSEVDRAMDETRRRFGLRDDESFQRALVASGSTLEDFRVRTRRQLLYGEVMRSEVAPKVAIEDEEINRYWRDHPEQFQVPERRRIEEAVVLDTTPLEAAERRRLATEIRDAVVAGESIADAVARLELGDEVLVLDHGWIERGELEPSLETAAWELGAGGVAGPLDGRGGLHVLRVVEIAAESVQPLEEVREQIRERLHGERFAAESDKMLERLARNAYIVDDDVPEGARGFRTAPSSESDPLRALMREAEPELEPEPAAEPPPPSIDEILPDDPSPA